MSEIKHKEWQTIKNLRDEIRQDIEDYTFFNTIEDYFPASSESWFFKYLESHINNNILKLKQLVSKEEENK